MTSADAIDQEILSDLAKGVKVETTTGWKAKKTRL